MMQSMAAIKASDMAKRMASKFLPKVKDLVLDQIKQQANDIKPLRN
jgi:hypothetical protein